MPIELYPRTTGVDLADVHAATITDLLTLADLIGTDTEVPA